MFDEVDLTDLDRLAACSRQLAAVQAEFMTILVAVAKASPELEFAAMEIAAALTWTRQAANAHLELAHDLVVRLPSVHTTLSAGCIDLPKARVIVERVSALDIPVAREVCEQILPDAPRMTTGQLRARLAKLVIAADPESATKAHQMRVSQRRLLLQPQDDSCAILGLYDVSAEAALAAASRVHSLARAIKQAGDPRSMDQIRADTAIDLLLGRETSYVTANVELVATLETLTSLGDSPGHLNGYGPVIADIARQIAHEQSTGQWSFTIHDEATGRVHTGLTRRRPSSEMARHIRHRDRTCRAPGCRVSASRADIDHTVAWDDGGLTAPSNLGLLCRYHHRAKHEGGWSLTQPRPGFFVWRSPLRRIYTVGPEPP